MKPRRSSNAPLPRAPLAFAYPLAVRAPGAEGSAILAEVRGEHALALVRALRLVLAWSLGPEPGGALLRPEALDEWEAELHAERFDEGAWWPLVALAAELRRPGRAECEGVAKCCVALGEWALGVEAESTALLFAEAAALAWPTSARHAWVAGRMLRNAGRLREAELWLRRAARVAVWTSDWEAQNLALHSLGNLYLQQGSYSEALRFLNRALKLAQRNGLREREGAACHDLFQVAVVTGHHSRAEDLATSAFELYGPGHPNLPKLAHDVVYLWLEQKRFLLALPVLCALLPLLPLPHERLRVLASTARAAGACGDRETYEAARAEARKLNEHSTPEVRGLLSGSLIDLAHGAASLSEWGDASDALRLALEVARERNAHDDAAEAEIVLDMIRRHEGEGALRRPASGAAARLSNAFVQVLREVAPGKHAPAVADDGTT